MTIHATAVIKVGLFFIVRRKKSNNMLRTSLTDALTILGNLST